MSRRTGSRWGGRDQQQQQQQQQYRDQRERHREQEQERPRQAYHQRPHVQQQQQQQQQQAAVSDEDAMKALMCSAESRSKEREGDITKPNDDSSRRDDGRNGGRNNTNTNNNNNNKNRENKSNEVSYYGPGGNNNDNDNDHYDRKRKRPLEKGREPYDPSRRGGNNNRRDDNAPRRVEADDDDNDEKKKDNDETKNSTEEEKPPPPQFKPNFGLSGALAKDTESGNVYKGVVLKFKEPPEARAPNTQWRLYVFKAQNKSDDKKKSANDNNNNNNNLVETLHISKQSAYLFGRNAVIADIPLLHPSLSSQHAVLQYRAVPVSTDNNISVCRTCILQERPYVYYIRTSFAQNTSKTP